MASIIAHELEKKRSRIKTLTPGTRSLSRERDKCAWTFGSATTLPTGAKYNMTWLAQLPDSAQVG
jgi:hypothetical protein